MEETMSSDLKKNLNQFVGIDLPDEEIFEPEANALAITKSINQEATNLDMDVEPANFTKLLHQLAPKNVKKSGITS